MASTAPATPAPAFWNLVRTDSIPSLDQGPRRGVAPRAELEPRLRAWCAEAGVPPERVDQVVAAGLLYHDHQDEAHDLVQDMTDVDGALIHAILHRREPDYWNAKYWFRRIGDHPVYRRLALAAAAASAEAPAPVKALARGLTLSGTLDPLRFVDAVESVARRGEQDPEVQFLRRLQHAEFECLAAHLLGA